MKQATIEHNIVENHLVMFLLSKHNHRKNIPTLLIDKRKINSLLKFRNAPQHKMISHKFEDFVSNSHPLYRCIRFSNSKRADRIYLSSANFTSSLEHMDRIQHGVLAIPFDSGLSLFSTSTTNQQSHKFIRI